MADFLLITKEIYRQSNRREAYLLPLMGLDKHIGYKSVERLYSDPLVIMVLHNMFLLSLQKRGIVEVDSCGDGTGYSLSMTKHYRSIREREDVKEGKFVYSFALMDLSSRMYVGYVVSIKSGKDAYHKALDMISDMRIDLRSVRLDNITQDKAYWTISQRTQGSSSYQRSIPGFEERKDEEK